MVEQAGRCQREHTVHGLHEMTPSLTLLFLPDPRSRLLLPAMSRAAMTMLTGNGRTTEEESGIALHLRVGLIDSKIGVPGPETPLIQGLGLKHVSRPASTVKKQHYHQLQARPKGLHLLLPAWSQVLHLAIILPPIQVLDLAEVPLHCLVPAPLQTPARPHPQTQARSPLLFQVLLLVMYHQKVPVQLQARRRLI